MKAYCTRGSVFVRVSWRATITVASTKVRKITCLGSQEPLPESG